MNTNTFSIDLYDLPGLLIRRLQQSAVSIFMAETAQIDQSITPVQFGALTVTHTHPGIDQVTLAGLIAYDKATMGDVISRLVTKGLMIRCVSKQDRRARELYLTETGHRLLEDMIPRVKNAQQLMLAGLDKQEQVQFLLLLKKATEGVNDRSRAPLRTLAC